MFSIILVAFDSEKWDDPSISMDSIESHGVSADLRYMGISMAM